jgi:hypothetical protein
MSDTVIETFVEFEEEGESSAMSSQHNNAKTAEAPVIWPYKSNLCVGPISSGDLRIQV